MFAGGEAGGWSAPSLLYETCCGLSDRYQVGRGLVLTGGMVLSSGCIWLSQGTKKLFSSISFVSKTTSTCGGKPR